MSVLTASLSLVLIAITLRYVWEPHVPLKTKANHFVLQLLAKGYVSKELLEWVIPSIGPTYPLFEDGIRTQDHYVLGKLKYRHYEVRGSTSDDAIIWAHGGGFVLGHIYHTHNDIICRMLARLSGCSVYAVEYRKAPQYRPSAGREDVLEMHRVLTGQLMPRGGRVALGGASAGATLSLGAALSLAHSGASRVDHLLLVYPALRHGFLQEGHSSWILSERVIRWFQAHHVIPESSGEVLEELLREPDSHLEHLRELPPVHLVSAGLDPMLPTAQKLDKELRKAGVALKHSHYPLSVHGFFSFHSTDTHEALQDAARSTFNIPR